jgi:hypothetical protein
MVCMLKYLRGHIERRLLDTTWPQGSHLRGPGAIFDRMRYASSPAAELIGTSFAVPKWIVA